MLNNKLSLNEKDIIKLSVTENKGLEELKQRIITLFDLEKIETKDLTYLRNARSLSLLKKSLKNINDAINNIENNLPIDIIEIDLKIAGIH